MESEMDTELRFHIQAVEEDLVRSGVPRPEALRRARMDFGGFERAKEECRDARGVNHVEGFLQDLRYGMRTLQKNPGFTALAVLILGSVSVPMLRSSVFCTPYSFVRYPIGTLNN